MTTDWFRRNWPDLLIGVALALVIAGIVAILLSGGTIFSGGSSFSSNTSTNTATNTAPQTTATTAQPDEDAAAPNTATVTTEGARAQGEATAATADTAAANIEAVLPESSQQSQAQTDTQTSAATDTSTTASAVTSTTTSATPPAPSAPSTAPARTASAIEAVSSGRYRVSIGAFGNPENAARLAARFRAEGFPVTVEPQGALSIVLVGPYASEAQADQVAAQIRQMDTPATVYERSGAATAPAASTAPQAAPAPQASASNVVYLQVGAYASAESSIPQRQQMRDLGFNVIERRQGDLIKVLIGPFNESALSRAEARLDAQGIDNFPVR
ncbi:MAG: SPOR domain-containing protein [Trueperaceae bacterium]|nr:SPOR domain-containing protein [Trueperaceae bacterium]